MSRPATFHHRKLVVHMAVQRLGPRWSKDKLLKLLNTWCSTVHRRLSLRNKRERQGRAFPCHHPILFREMEVKMEMNLTVKKTATKMARKRAKNREWQKRTV